MLVWVSSAVALFVLCWRLGELPLMDPDEGRNAEVGREMLVSGAWLVPTLDGLVYLDKPAFFFRAVAVSLDGFGHEEWAARLPSALAGLLTLVLLFAFCRGRYGDRTAALAVLVAATAPLFFGMARIVIMDTLLGLFVCAAVFAAVVAEERAAEGRDRERRGWYLLSALSAGLATLVKGPVGFLVPALVVIGWVMVEGVERRRGFWRRLGAPLNLVAFLAVVLPWFLGVVHERPDFLYYGLVEESLRRFATGSFHRSQPFYYFLGVVAAGLFAWSLLLPEAMLLAWQRRSRWSPTDRLFVVWSLVVVVFFSLSQSKQPAYILTAVVAQAALLARLLASALAVPAGAPGRAVLRGGVAAAVLYALTAAALLVLLFRPELLVGPRRQGMTTGWLASPAQPALLTPLAESALALVGGSVLGLAGRWRREPRFTVAALSLLPLVLFGPGFDLLRGYAGMRSSRPLAVRVAALAGQLSGHRAGRLAGHMGSPPSSASGGPAAAAPVAPAEPSPGDLSLSGSLEGVVAPAGREAESWEIACLACFPAGLPYYLERPVVVLDADAGSDELRSNYILFMQRRGRSATGPAAAPAQEGETEEVLVPSRRLESWLAAHTRGRAVLVLARRQRLARLARLVQVADLAAAARPPLDERAPRGRPDSAAAPAPGSPGSSRREAGSVDLVQLTPGWWGALLPAGAFSDAFSEKSSVTGGAHGGGS